MNQVSLVNSKTPKWTESYTTPMEETYGAHLRCLENTAKSDFAVQKWSPHQKKKEIRCVHNQRWQHLKTPTTGALQYIQPRRKCWKLQIKWLKMLIKDYFMLFKTSKRKKKNTLRISYMKPGRLWFMSQKSHWSLQTWKLQCRTGQRPLNSMRQGSTGS